MQLLQEAIAPHIIVSSGLIWFQGPDHISSLGPGLRAGSTMPGVDSSEQRPGVDLFRDVRFSVV